MARRRGTVQAVRDRSVPVSSASAGEELPIRTCVGCRTKAAASGLLRVVADRERRVSGQDTVLVPDPRRRLPGRGAWLHRDLECLRIAERRRAFPRALRVAGTLDTAAVRAHLEQLAGVPPDSRRGSEPTGSRSTRP